MHDELLARAQDAVRLAQGAGAADAWASADRTREVEFSYRDGKLEKVQESTSRSLSLNIYADGRYSSHSTTDLRPDRLDAFVQDAVALTRALQPDDYRKITDPALFEGRSDKDLEQTDGGLQALTADDRLALCTEQYEAIAGDDKIISITSGSSDGHWISASASSNGFEGTQESTWLWIGSEVTLRDEGDARREAWLWGGAPYQEDLPDPGEVARMALARAEAQLGSEKGPTRKTTMVVDPSVGGRLIGQLLRPASGRSVQQGRSCLADRIGKKVSSGALTIVDDPLVVRGLGSRHYDSEGIAAKELPIITKGVLNNFYLDTYYARKLQLDPTTGSASNRVVKLGKRDRDALIAAAPDGAILVEAWLGGNADTTTGDFSLGARGRLIQKGRLTRPVTEMNVTGNLLDLFVQLAEVGNDPWPWGRTRTPTLVFENVQFSGA